MCGCFGSKSSLDQRPLQPVPRHRPAETDDLSHAFQTLSIQERSDVRSSPPVIEQTYRSNPVHTVPNLATNRNITPQPINNVPTFPLKRVHCRTCGWQPRYRNTVSTTNDNGNEGRHYYICVQCKRNRNLRLSRTDREIGWITWDDAIGISADNRPCFCHSGALCRQDRAGPNSFNPGGGFWTCATGSCNFLSFRVDALTEDEARKGGWSQMAMDLNLGFCDVDEECTAGLTLEDLYIDRR